MAGCPVLKFKKKMRTGWLAVRFSNFKKNENRMASSGCPTRN